MATANQILENSAAAKGEPGLLVILASMGPEELAGVLASLASFHSADDLIVATPDTSAVDTWPQFRIVPVPSSTPSWTLTATDFVNAYQLAEQNHAHSILILGPGSESLTTPALSTLAQAVVGNSVDMAVPSYDLPANAGLVNSAILYPLTRSLFATRVRFPLAIDMGLSLRMAQRLATAAQRFISVNQGTAQIWPVNEAAAAGMTIKEFEVGHRVMPQPVDPDINAILAQLTGSLFADVDAKAAFWQRARPLPPLKSIHTQPSNDAAPDIGPMLDAFRLAYTNLREIWSLVLPPNTLLELKRLYSTMDAASFRMPDHVWARIVFDFLLAYRLRTINRGHLLGALIPLYLACVASHINIASSGTHPEKHIEGLAAAFEAEKAYLVSRWRWPDRFNP